jgi:hypothetical protein
MLQTSDLDLRRRTVKACLYQRCSGQSLAYEVKISLHIVPGLLCLLSTVLQAVVRSIAKGKLRWIKPMPQLPSENL